MAGRKQDQSILCKKNKEQEKKRKKKERTQQKSVSQFTSENTGSITERDNLQMEFFFSHSFAHLWPLLMSSSLHSHGTGAKKP